MKRSEECRITYPSTSKCVKKTRLRLVFSTHFSVFGYVMKHSSSCFVYYIKHFEAIVDDKLLWNEHIDGITIRASKGLGMLRRMKPFVPRSILITIYKPLILLYLDYCCLVWDNCSNYLLDNLQKIQNKAARIITGESYEIRSSDLLRKLNWPNLKERRSHKKAIFMFEVKNEQVAQSVAELFSVTNNENHELRSKNKKYFD